MSGAIVIHHERCLNFNYPQAGCRRCVEGCPTAAVTAVLTVDPNRCCECGLCLANCPVEAIGGENFSWPVLTEMLDSTADPLGLACRRQDGQSSWPCLGFLDGRLLLAFIDGSRPGGRQVVLDSRNCRSCKPRLATYLEDLVDAVNRLAGPGGKPTIILGAAEPASPGKKLSRRAFFTGLVGLAAATVREAVSGSAWGGERLTHKEIFRRYGPFLETDLPAETGLFNNLIISENCRACGRCPSLCPHGAITAKDQGTELVFYHNPALCTGCAMCTVYCPAQAVSLTPAVRLAEYQVAQRKFPCCTVCGQIFQPAGNQTVCLECRLTARPANG